MKLNDTDRGPLNDNETPLIEPKRARRASDDTQLIGSDAESPAGHDAHQANAGRRLIDPDATAPMDVTSIDESVFTLSLPFKKTMVAADTRDTPSEAETASIAVLLRDDGKEVSADVAEHERMIRPTPAVFLPGNKQRTTRSILTIIISIVTVLALVGVGILFAVKSQAATPEQQAFEAYSARQLTVATADRTLTSTYSAISTATTEAESVNLAAAAALAAVAGVSDETARAAAETQRVTTAAAIAEVVAVDPAETPYAAPGVSAGSSLSVIGAALDEISAEATRIEAAQLELDAALTAITDARTAFATAFTTFTDTIPATATALIEANTDAGQEWRDAVSTAVTALTTAVKNGGGAAELQAYAAAAFALQDENARVLLEQQESVDSEENTTPQTPNRPRNDSNPDPVTPPRPTPPAPGPVVPPVIPEVPEEPVPVDPPTDPVPE
ncbi:hypothetical protein D9V29_01805 [Mycetocola manganoxydans]|uniref:Uncharacterized protein n=1 Tax=Mycetocola manganoxydans TaxID=699879 RepID=A0A3L6ZZH7_9MICO|nr:hypothetical protein [Mycetocola manganoxydans]RLP73446.1 hypothetical protein D9V29_01805 [Mycetocola manganoxydans]GHD41673.1 hypothetical protein GCM10008097_06680 [Mycetocola manganoxydans]